MKKTALYFFVFVFVGVFVGFVSKEDRTQDYVLSFQSQLAEIPAIFQIGQDSYQVKVPEKSSVYDLMKLMHNQHDFTFKGREFTGLGFFVDEIQGKKQSPKEGKYWIYYINGQKAKVGVSNYIIQPHDSISWKYEDEE